MRPYLAHAAQILVLPVLIVALRLVARRLPPRRPAFWKRISLAATSLARRPLSCAAVLCVPLVLSAALFAVRHGPPIPFIHDEFSYLLAADTFASGRLTNPTHPMWVHFESFHIIHTPSYMSMYPPLQGLVLAAGLLLGHPWMGVLLSSFTAILLLWWAARQWLPPRWALLAGLMGALLVTATYWSESYWGGSANASAGALVGGAAGMLRRRFSASGLALFVLGAVLCAASRPYEGAVLCLLLSVWLAFGAIRRRHARPIGLFVLAPASLILILGAGSLLAYNRAVTGNPLRLPYQVAYDQYFLQGRFVFEKGSPTAIHRHPALAEAYRNLNRPAFRPYTRLYYSYLSLQQFYLGIPLFTLLAFSLAALRLERTRAAILTTFAGLAALLAVPVVIPHYYAPFAALFLVAAVQGVRVLPGFLPSPALGWLARVVLISLLAYQFLDQITPSARYPGQRDAWAAERARIEHALLGLPGQHLVIVRYSPAHSPDREWVYNRADIDSSPVVWARAMDERNDAKLRRYFSSRRIWVLDADAEPPRISALSAN